MARKCTHLLIYGTNECLIYLWQSFSLCFFVYPSPFCSVSLSLSLSLCLRYTRLPAAAQPKDESFKLLYVPLLNLMWLVAWQQFMLRQVGQQAGVGSRWGVGGRTETGSLPAYAAHIIRIASPKKGDTSLLLPLCLLNYLVLLREQSIDSVPGLMGNHIFWPASTGSL